MINPFEKSKATNISPRRVVIKLPLYFQTNIRSLFRFCQTMFIASVIAIVVHSLFHCISHLNICPFTLSLPIIIANCHWYFVYWNLDIQPVFLLVNVQTFFFHDLCPIPRTKLIHWMLEIRRYANIFQLKMRCTWI